MLPSGFEPESTVREAVDMTREVLSRKLQNKVLYQNLSIEIRIPFAKLG